MRTFYIYLRNKSRYYVQFTDPITGRRKTGHTTGKKTLDEAFVTAYQMMCTDEKSKSVRNPLTAVMDLITKQAFSETDAKQLIHALALRYETSAPLAVSAPTVAQDVAVSVSENSTTPLYLIQYLNAFWNFDTSAYIADKLEHGHKISKRYCYEQTNLIKYWTEYFSADYLLTALTVEKLKKFEKYLFERESQKERIVKDETTGESIKEKYAFHLSTTTRKNILRCASVAFDWAVREKMMVSNVCEKLTKYTVKNKKRGILTRSEARDLFTKGTWLDERAHVASLVAMTTGLRISEILSLRQDDIAEDRLYINHSWSGKDGLTTTKNTEPRVVPIIPTVRNALQKLAMQNPYKSQATFYIFWGNLPDRPVVPNVITEGFCNALESIDISEVMRKERNVVFHSWRHFYATAMTDALSERHAQITLGHLTVAMTRHYNDHRTEEAIQEVFEVSKSLFGDLLA